MVQSFVNSVNVEFGPDEFATDDGFRAWLLRKELIDDHVEADELDRRDAIALREALRSVLRENNGVEADPDAHRVIEHVSRHCPLIVDGSLTLRPALGDVRGGMARILASVASAVADGSWQRLKACQEHRCEWIFYDRSRNRASRWCSMAVCGTRAKMRVYRQRVNA